MAERVSIRAVDPRQDERVKDVVCEAFGSTVEYRLIEQLRNDKTHWLPAWSIGAIADDKLVGHILFTRASVGGVKGALLAPLAVVNSHQGQGVGERLCRAGLEAAKSAGATFALVLGHPDYYPRVGFEPAYPHGILPPYAVEPHSAWMATALVPGALELARGVASVADAFMRPEMWREG